MEKLLQDLRYALRSLFRQPAFALTAICTLALGIGATTAIFSVVNTVLLRPLPFDEPERIVAIQNMNATTGNTSQNVSAPDFHDWKAQSGSFEAMGYYQGGEWSATVNGAADYVLAFTITPGFLETLRAEPSVGRLFTDEEQRKGGPLAAVITDAYWKRQFNGDPKAVGSTIKFDDRVFTIVGVLQPNIRFPARTDFYYPAIEEETPRSGHNYRAIGRLKGGVSLAQAQAEMTEIAKRLAHLYPRSNENKLVALVPLQDVMVGPIGQTLWVLFGAVGVVLLIACANVANLLLARSSVRAREMVVRAAVGASRTRLIRQLLTESAVLGLTSALLGAWIARLGTRALVGLAPDAIPRLGEIQVDLFALGFALAVAMLASLLFGLAPALHVSRVHLVEGLRQGGKGSSTGSRTGYARGAFVVVEIALAVVLVAGAALLGRSLAALTSLDLGFDPARLLVLQTAVPVATADEAPRATNFYRDLLPEFRSLPGVEAAGAVRSLPTRVMSSGGYGIEGGVDFTQQGVRLPRAIFNVATPGYFETLRVPLRRGRNFDERDRRGATMTVIVNESLVRQSFRDRDPIGQRIQCGFDTLEFMTIVGVVADMRSDSPGTPPQPEIWMPYEQHPRPSTGLNIVMRVRTADPLALAETVRRRIASINPDVPVRATTMDGTLTTASATPRFRTFLIGVFAGLALLLALAGIYGVMTYTVSQRVPELGVRIALGATPGHIMGLIIGQGAALAAIGLVLGIVLALVSGRWLEGMLFGVTARDPWILATVTVGVALATLLACYIPGRRAVRVDPMVALRAE